MRVRLASTIAVLFVVWGAARTPLAQKAPPPPKKNPLLKLAEAWPEDDVLQVRRVEADSRRLFSETAPLAFTNAALVFEENQDAELDRFAVVASEYVPVRVNCWILLVPMEMFEGVRATEVRTVTVNVADALNVPEAAPMVATPWPAPVASPAALIGATPGAEELHWTEAVRSCVVLLVNVPVARNACVLPFGIEGLVGETDRDRNTGAVTVRVVDPLTVSDVAVMVVAP